jgi:hypothetical protein
MAFGGFANSSDLRRAKNSEAQGDEWQVVELKTNNPHFKRSK